MLVLQLAAGLGLISIGILFVGSVIGINRLVCWIIALVLAIFLWRDAWAWLSGWRALINLWADSGRFGKALGFGIFSLVLCTFILSLAPPVKFDALVYHLTFPKLYLLSGGVRYIPENMFWGMPQVGEMLYTWAMGLAGNATATMVGWWAGVLALCGLIGYTVDRFGINAAWVATTSLIGGYTMTILLSAGYIEWFSILFGISLLIAFDIWWTTRDMSALIWAGIICGLAMGSKYTGGILLFAGVGVVWIQHLLQKNGNRSLMRSLAAFLLPALLVFSPWLVKNLLATGNPVYPFFFPAGSMDLFRIQAYQIQPWGDWRDIVLLPLRATITGYEGAPGYNASISPLLIALAPFSVIGYKSRTEKQRTALLIASTVGITGWIAWLLASRFSGYLIQTRMYFAIFPAFAVLAGAGYQAIADIRLPGLRLGRIIAALVVMVLYFNIIHVVTEFIDGGSLNVLLNVSAPDDYLNDRLGWYYPAAQAISNLPEDSHVLMLWEPRSFYCQPKCIPDEVLDQWRHARQSVGEPGKIIESWRNRGYTHLLYNRFGADFVRSNDTSYQTSDWVVLDDLLTQLSVPVKFGNAYELYSLQR